MNDLLLLHTNASNTYGICMGEAMKFVTQVMEVGDRGGGTHTGLHWSLSLTPHGECYT